MTLARVVLICLGITLFTQCSVKKTDWVHRYYHDVVTRFNRYFNAKELMMESEVEIDLAIPDDYTKTLPVYKELDDENRALVSDNMDLILEKCAKDITKNSMRKGRKEYNKWIDDCYLTYRKSILLQG